MHYTTLLVSLAVAFRATFCAPALAQEDTPGCKDHPFFSKMPQYYLEKCTFSEFDSYAFSDPDTQGKTSVTVEGRKYVLEYKIRKEYYDTPPTALQVARNYAGAVIKIGGSAYVDRVYTYTKYVKDGLAIWGYIFAGNRFIRVILIEKASMKQDIVADAKTMASDIRTSGKVALYGIYFDFNEAVIKPESAPALQEIGKLLREDSGLKLYVVGHTDNVGGFDYNMNLSRQRAEAVVKELLSKYKIAPDRLRAGGVGPLAPVTSNDTEEGKARNRRVELVKQ